LERRRGYIIGTDLKETDRFISFLKSSGEAGQTAEPGKTRIGGLRASSKALVLSRIFLELGRPLVIFTPDSKSSEDMARDMGFFIGSSKDIYSFPSYGLPPYHEASPPTETMHQRLSCLLSLCSSAPIVVVSSMEACLRRTIPCDIFLSFVVSLTKGCKTELEALVRSLTEGGYARVNTVESAGEFAVRGGIVDVFPPSIAFPIRLELEGDRVASLRGFDPDTQRSTDEIQEVLVPPAREVILNEESLACGEENLKRLSDEMDLARRKREEIWEGLRSPETGFQENFLPIFYSAPGSLLDYLPSSSLVVIDDRRAVEESAGELLRNAAERHRKAASQRPVPTPESLFLSLEEFSSRLKRLHNLFLEPLKGLPEPDFEFNVSLPPQVREKYRTSVLDQYASEVGDWLDKGLRVFFVSQDPERFIRLFEGHHLKLRMLQTPFFKELREGTFSDSSILIKGSLSSGFVLASEGVAIVSEEDIFGPKRKFRPFHSARPYLSYADLKEGNYVVHTLYGIGLYKGLQHLLAGGIGGDYLFLEYAGGDRLYLPVYGMRYLQKYHSGGEGRPTLDRLGTLSWKRRRKKVEDSLKEMAEELIKIYAMKKTLPGFSFTLPDAHFEEFEATFPFEETPDQKKAIEDVLDHMHKGEAMDRLVCGDVGFGKTEVAIRAAFKAAMDLKQVAVLVPTTLLAHQHFRNFAERLKPYPIIVEMLSRFVPRKKQAEIIERLREGRVDIIIGTHRLLQDDVSFKDLGLLIIDEEHRFGVAAKEKLRKLRASIDVLSLTATPIPRTLQMSLSGIRDLSVIATPPPDRRAIQTLVAPFDEDIICEAVERELARGGQVFFVHNRVKSLPAMADLLRNLFPQARLGVAHGQMDDRELEKTMVEFLERKIDILACTAIVESGLDIPNANTMLINKANAYGLAELYQLRGRVGRSSETAYAYLLVPEGELSGESRKRLQALRDFMELGSGFRLALQDLEIRGAGNLLGSEQSGHIASVGYDLYCDLLEDAVRNLKGEGVEEEINTEVSVPFPAYLPESYVKGTGERLIAYKRLAMAVSETELYGLEEELRDRYGPLPPEAANLFLMLGLKLCAKPLKVTRLDVGKSKVMLTFHETTPLSPEALLELVRQNPKKYHLVPSSTVSASLSGGSPEEICSEVSDFLRILSGV